MYRILLFFCLNLPICAAQNYYVDGTNGNNNNTGTSLANAWRTIQKACNSATPGSTVYIRGGVYTEQVWMNVSGSAGNPITFTPYNNEVVRIDGGSTGNYTELFVIDNQQYITLNGLEFANAMGNFSKGIIIQNGASHIQILNNKIHDIHFSTNPNASVNSTTNVNPFVVYNQNASTSCTDIVVSGNEIYDCRTGFSEACTFNGNVDGFEVSNNMIHDITNIGIDAAGGYGVCSDPNKDFARNGEIFQNITWNCVSQIAVSAGIYVDGGQNILIERNISHDNGRGFEVGCERPGHTTTQVIVRNNISYHNREAGLGIGGYDFPNTGKVTQSQVYNNTLYDNVFTNNGDGELLIEYTENCTVQQNIFYASNPAKKLLVTRLNSSGLSMDYNLYYHSAGSTQVVLDWNGTVYTGFSAYQAGVAANSIDVHTQFGNPLFINAPTLDFQLQNGSPAIQGGAPGFMPASGETDYYGNTRLVNGRIDIGAAESQVPLSIHLLEFGASIRHEAVELYWALEPQPDLYRILVERSSNGVDFSPLESLPVQPTGRYTCTDKTPIEGLNYYRLQFEHLDASLDFSPIRSVDMDKTQALRIWPNPAKGFIFIATTANFTRTSLFSASGHLVAEWSLEKDEALKIPDLAPGIYYLSCSDRQGHSTPVTRRITIID